MIRHLIAISLAALALPSIGAAQLEAKAPVDWIGETVTIEQGEVTGPVRVGNGHLEVIGRVRGSITGTHSPIVVRDGGIVEGDIRSFAGPVTIRSGGGVEGSVTVNAAEARVTDGGWVVGDLSALRGDATVEAGGQVGGKVLAPGGARTVEDGARVGGAMGGPAGAEDEQGFRDLASMAFVLWLFGTVLGAGLCSALSSIAGARVDMAIAVWRDHRGQALSWGLGLVGACVLLALIPCIGWLALIPLMCGLAAAAALGWTALLRMIGERMARGRSLKPGTATLMGFAVWAGIGLVGVFPCFLPIVLPLKGAALLFGASTVLLSDWGRDPNAGGCWPVNGWGRSGGAG